MSIFSALLLSSQALAERPLVGLSAGLELDARGVVSSPGGLNASLHLEPLHWLSFAAQGSLHRARYSYDFSQEQTRGRAQLRGAVHPWGLKPGAWDIRPGLSLGLGGIHTRASPSSLLADYVTYIPEGSWNLAPSVGGLVRARRGRLGAELTVEHLRYEVYDPWWNVSVGRPLFVGLQAQCWL